MVYLTTTSNKETFLQDSLVVLKGGEGEELFKNFEEVFPWYYMDSDTIRRFKF